jgi:anti-sigma factor RsiW
MNHPASHRLSAYLDGDLTPELARELEGHLEECRECSELLADLEGIRARARELPDQFPTQDLWPGIERAIREDAQRDPDVIRLHPAMRAGPAKRRAGFRLSLPQAAVAGLVLALFSGAVGARLGRTPAPETAASPPTQASWVNLVTEASPSLETSALEVARLEEVLASHRQELDPVTAGILEKNLYVIDQAIRESVAALRVDPGNRYLETHLERSIRAKGQYLRDAALLVGWIS